MIYTTINPIIGWIIIGILGLLAFIFIDIGIRKREYSNIGTETKRYKLIPKNNLHINDMIALQHLVDRMDIQHGHNDEDGIEADRRDGYSWSDINNMPCHMCHKPRNQKGGHFYG